MGLFPPPWLERGKKFIQQCPETVTVAGMTVPLGPVLIPGFFLLLGLVSAVLASAQGMLILRPSILLPHHLQTLKHFQVSTGKVNPVPTKCPNVSTLMGVGLSHLPISYIFFPESLGQNFCLLVRKLCLLHSTYLNFFVIWKTG